MSSPNSTIIAHLRSLNTLLSSAQLAAILGIKVGTLAAWHQRNRGPARIKVGAVVRFDPATVADWLESTTVTPQPLQQPKPLPSWLQPQGAQHV